jgi:ElaB/YqjD/DUF883 family membrane-anchored ribosome-binding protein
MATSDPFQPSTSSAGSAIADSATDLKDKVSDFASDARDKASELGGNTADAIDKGLHTAGDKLRATADSLRNTGTSGSTRISDLSHTAAEKLESTARYFEEYDTRDLMNQLEQTVRRNPGPALAAAAAVGFLIGTALRNRD